MRLARTPIAPGSEIPATTIGQKEGIIQLNKWANRFRITYEAIREFNVRIDKLAFMVQREGLFEANRMIGELAGVLKTGDGTTGSAATVVKGVTLDSARTAGELSSKMWLSFGPEFKAPYVLTHALMRKKQAIQLILLTTGSANIHVSQLINANAEGVPSIASMNVTSDAVRYGWLDDTEITEHQIYGVDSRFAVEKVMQVGGEVREQAQNITSQTQDVVVSSTYNWAKLDFTAIKVLDTNVA